MIREVLFFPLDTTKTINIYTHMHKESDIINFEGREWQVCSVRLVNEPGSVGEDEILYVLMDRQGNLRDVMDWELADYNAKRGNSNE